MNYLYSIIIDYISWYLPDFIFYARLKQESKSLHDKEDELDLEPSREVETPTDTSSTTTS